MAASEQFILDVPAEPRYVSTARLFAVAIGRQLDCDEDTIEDLKLAISEAMSLKIAKPSSSSRLVRVAIELDGQDMVVGIAESPLSDQAASTSGGEPADELALALIEGLFPDTEILKDRPGLPIQFRLSASSRV